MPAAKKDEVCATSGPQGLIATARIERPTATTRQTNFAGQVGRRRSEATVRCTDPAPNGA